MRLVPDWFGRLALIVISLLLLSCSSSEKPDADQLTEAERETMDYVVASISRRCSEKLATQEGDEFEQCFREQADWLRTELEQLRPGPPIECAAATACNRQHGPWDRINPNLALEYATSDSP